MKGSLISFVLTALLLTSLFQPHHNILAVASQNNTDEGSNGCIGLCCLFMVDEEADFVRPSRMLSGGPPFDVRDTKFHNKSSPYCKPIGLYGGGCLGSRSPQYIKPCANMNRVYSCNNHIHRMDMDSLMLGVCTGRMGPTIC